MSFTYVTDIRIRLTALAPDGTQFIEEVGINGDQTQEEIWACAHSQADGSDPDPRLFPRAVWGVAMNLRKAERRLQAKLRDWKDQHCTKHETGIYTPQNAKEWEALGLPVPDHVFSCEPVKPGLFTPLPLEAFKPDGRIISGAPRYQQTVTGWSRKPIVIKENSADSEASRRVVAIEPTREALEAAGFKLDSAEYHAAAAVFDSAPGNTTAPLAAQAAMVSGFAFTRWKCTQPGCPDRAPREAPSAPVCYTCGQPTDRVP